jgi:DNA-binding MarR family transcriptional regulator
MKNSTESNKFVLLTSQVFANMFLGLTRLQTAGDKFDPSISMKQWLLLAVLLKTDSSTLTAIGKRLGCSRQNVKKLANPLIREGFLILQTDPQDARAVKLEITKKCEHHLAAREPHEIKFIELLFQDFSLEELSQLYTLLNKYLAGIERLENKVDTGELIISQI